MIEIREYVVLQQSITLHPERYPTSWHNAPSIDEDGYDYPSLTESK